MDLPEYLVKEVRDGRVVLFLGAGASRGASRPDGSQPPTSVELATLLSQSFLGGAEYDNQLDWVSSLAIAESDIITVQDFIADCFRDLRPAQFHALLPTFRWFGLVTTNYDLLVETVYAEADHPAQRLVPARSQSDRITDAMRSEDALLLLKLHGCISITRDPNTPLILTPEQYIRQYGERHRLLDVFRDWATEHTVVFIGHALRDYDLQYILAQLAALQAAKPTYYLVTPSITDPERRLWASRRVHVLDGTFREFLEALHVAVPRGLRTVATQDRQAHPIENRLVRHVGLSERARAFLTNGAEYVHAGMPTENPVPGQFYKGYGQGWSAIQAQLDVRRSLVDRVIQDVILAEETDRPTGVEFFLIRAEAGAGKTVCMRRIAWDASVEWGRLVLFALPDGHLDYEPIEELVQLTDERLFLFVDDAANRVTELLGLLRRAKRGKVRLTVIAAERINEWNMAAIGLEEYVTEEHELHNLNEREMEQLVVLLEEHNSLGRLANSTHQERVDAFRQRAQRQLLVALHEATQGKPFEEILEDEFREIRPLEAQRIYLTICILNRLDVAVRAGIVSRVHGVAFEKFRDEFFRPLEHVVRTAYDPSVRDMAYTARHPLIAEIVFQRILANPDERFDRYARLLDALNPLYDSDRQGFRRMIRGRTILRLFPDHDAAREVYHVAQAVGGDDPYLFQQLGIYEMNRPNGNLTGAYEYLRRAQQLAPNDWSIVHSLAELALQRASQASAPLERARYRTDARKLAQQVIERQGGAPGFHTLVKAALDDLRDILRDPRSQDDDVDQAVAEVEKWLQRGLQRFPEAPTLLASEGDLWTLLEQHERATRVLERAFRANRRNPFIVGRLAKIYKRMGRMDDAVAVCKEALQASPGDQRLHYVLGMLLREGYPGRREEIRYHLRRGFVPGDHNYDAQFWYAVYLYMTDEVDSVRESKALFRQLRDAPLPPASRRKIRARYEDEHGSVPEFRGRVSRLEDAYGFIERERYSDTVFIHRRHTDEATWSGLREGAYVTFQIGFDMAGPVALELRLR